MRMMVFDHRTCRWRPWHGTRVAWLKLPHAVAAAGVCALSATVPLALSSHPHVNPVPRSSVTSSASADDGLPGRN
jgi:hypothetical protein